MLQQFETGFSFCSPLFNDQWSLISGKGEEVIHLWRAAVDFQRTVQRTRFTIWQRDRQEMFHQSDSRGQCHKLHHHLHHHHHHHQLTDGWMITGQTWTADYRHSGVDNWLTAQLLVAVGYRGFLDVGLEQQLSQFVDWNRKTETQLDSDGLFLMKPRDKNSPSAMEALRSGSAWGAWGVSALNRFLLHEEVLKEEVLSSSPPPPPLPVASTRSENRVTRSCRSSSTSLSFCWMSAREEERKEVGTRSNTELWQVKNEEQVQKELVKEEVK